MVRSKAVICASVIFLLCGFPAAQQSASSTSPLVPRVVNFSGLLTDVNGKPETGVIGVTFYLYKDSEGGVPLWMETQNVEADGTGHYSVMLGSTTGHGLPASLFASAEARWLAVQEQGQAEQPRIMLLSVPYALKAADAETLGGLPASEYLRTNASGGNTIISPIAGSSKAGKNSSEPSSFQVTTPGGTVGSIPQFTDTSVIANSLLQWNNTTSTLSTVNITAEAMNGVFNAAMFTGTGNGDIGDKIDQVYHQCPAVGCRIRVPANPAGGCWIFSTPITITTPSKPAIIEGDPAGTSCLNFTPATGNAVSLDWGTAHLGAGGLRDITLVGPSSGSGNGVSLGPTIGTDQAVLSGVNIQKFGGACLQFNIATNITVEKSQIHSCFDGAAWTGPDELDRFVDDNVFGNSNFGFDLPVNSVDLQISGSSCDDNLKGCINNGTSAVFIHGTHFENISYKATATYIINTGGIVVIDGGNMMDDVTSGTVDALIHNKGGVVVCPELSVYSGGQTVTQVILSSTENGTPGLTNCHIQNSTPTLIQADYNTSYIGGQAITWPLNHKYNTINWLNSPISVGSGNFSLSTSGTIPLILNCTTATACGMWLQKRGTLEWQISVDPNNNFILSNASDAPILQLTQAGKLTVNTPPGAAPLDFAGTSQVASPDSRRAKASDQSPTECKNQAATGIAANGDLSCSAISSTHVDATVATYGTSLVTTASSLDHFAILGVSSSSHCVLTATNAAAATNIATTYISAKTENQITVTHTAKSGMTYDVLCKAN